MKYIKTIAFFMVIGIAATGSRGATYYVSSATGNDAYTAGQAQNPATPWQTLVKVSSQVFSAGDNILFKCGDSWQGSITVSSSGAAGNPITYGSYGTGADPAIKGTVTISSPWTRYSGNIFVADVQQNIDRVFLNGQPMTLARYPNTGYIAITDTLSAMTFTCNLLNTVDWTNATVHVRTMHWTIATKKALACNSAQKSLTLDAAPVYGLKPGWGFFINNSLQALDTAGEWYYDSIGQKLYVWTPSGDSPANYIVEGSTNQTGFSLVGKSYIVIQGFTIAGQAQYGITGSNVSNVIIKGNRVSFADAVGICINGPNCTIQNDTIEGSSRNGVEISGASLTFSGNVVRNIALIRNFTKYGLGDLCCSGLALEATGSNAQILGNTIDSIGYIGIRPDGANNLIENNFVRHCCLTKDDGAGIYTGWQSDSTQIGSAGTIIRKNIVLGSQSAPAGTPDIAYTPGEGIYIDDYGHDVSIIQNTTADCVNHGIFLHHNRNITVSGNISYNNKVQFGFDESSGDAAGYVRGNAAKGNIFYSLSDQQICFENSAVATALLVTTDSNYYCNPYGDIIITKSGSGYGLSGWQIATGQDAHSKTSLVSLSRYQVLDTLGANLVANGTFASAVSPWSGWPAAVKTTWANNAGLDTGCMRVAYDNDSAASSCLVYPSSFGLTAHQTYELSFSVLSLNATASLQTIVRQAHTPWAELGLSKYFTMHNTRKNYSCVFFADSTDAQSRVDFSNTKADSVYWLDNVSILPVHVAAQDSQQKSPLFYNASSQTQNVGLQNHRYRDLDGNLVTGSISLAPFMSKILVLDTGTTAAGRLTGPMHGAPGITICAMAGGLRYRITFEAEAPAIAEFALYDLRGRMKAAVRNCRVKAGMNLIIWDGKDLQGKSVCPGNYLAEMTAGKCRFTRKFLKVN
jgi:hypothetical protein